MKSTDNLVIQDVSYQHSYDSLIPGGVSSEIQSQMVVRLKMETDRVKKEFCGEPHGTDLTRTAIMFTIMEDLHGISYEEFRMAFADKFV